MWPFNRIDKLLLINANLRGDLVSERKRNSEWQAAYIKVVDELNQKIKEQECEILYLTKFARLTDDMLTELNQEVENLPKGIKDNVRNAKADSYKQ